LVHDYNSALAERKPFGKFEGKAKIIFGLVIPPPATAKVIKVPGFPGYEAVIDVTVLVATVDSVICCEPVPTSAIVGVARFATEKLKVMSQEVAAVALPTPDCPNNS